MRLKTYEEMNAEQQMAYDIGVATFKASLTSPETIEKVTEIFRNAGHQSPFAESYAEAVMHTLRLRSVEEGKT